MRMIERSDSEGKVVITVERIFFFFWRKTFKYLAKQEWMDGHWIWVSMPNNRKVHYGIEKQLDEWNRLYRG